MSRSNSPSSSSPKWRNWLVLPSLIVALVAIVTMWADQLERRDASLNIAWPRRPIPENGRIVTIQHSPQDIEAYVRQESSSPSSRRQPLLIAPQVDIYYEVYEHDDCQKYFVILESTNAYTGVFHNLLDRIQALGFCTLVFDWRAHGRSEDTPGDITSELFMLDAAAMIETVFPGKAVHVFGWSLGGFIAYQLAIYKPELVASLVIYGSSACFNPIPQGQTECVDQWSFLKALFSTGFIMRLIGLEAEARLGAMAGKFKTPVTYEFQHFFHSLRMHQKVKTPRVWLQVQGAKTFSQLHKITCPFLQIAGEHEVITTGVTKYTMELEASRIAKAESPILLEDPSGQGYSHFAIFEEGGMDLIVGHMTNFYDKHTST